MRDKDKGYGLIEMRLDEPRRLFSTLDPAPFRERDLDPEAEEYLIESAEELHRNARLKLLIHLPESFIEADSGSHLVDAVHHYFDYRAEVASRQLRRKLRDGRISLVIGLAFLIGCLSARSALGDGPHTGWLSVLDEGLLISGWVAMWQPIQILLYDWWPIRRRMRLQRRLAGMPIELRARHD